MQLQIRMQIRELKPQCHDRSNYNAQDRLKRRSTLPEKINQTHQTREFNFTTIENDERCMYDARRSLAGLFNIGPYLNHRGIHA